MDKVKETIPKPKQKPRGASAMGAGPGRPKGLPNKTTTEFKHVVTALLEKNAANVEIWLASVANGDAENQIKPDPYKALDMLHKLAEYSFPKLARTEHSGDVTIRTYAAELSSLNKLKDD